MGKLRQAIVPIGGIELRPPASSFVSLLFFLPPQGLQLQIQDKLMHLESLNWLYRQLGQADEAGWQGRLRAAVQDSNQRWDDLQTRAAAVCKRLKYVVSQREEFEWEREAIQVWLMELDLRLTDVEHFSGGSSLEKMSQLQVPGCAGAGRPRVNTLRGTLRLMSRCCSEQAGALTGARGSCV
ncbi:nesprin-2-like [Alligator sinensis]|uniref:Nesprin-2-like n=1 Tax=Alligator sinensis TaxID=38654 RepID=A0A3Q0HDP1_ALLSI|nr:nesprin-2-like [Alligator sinensis]